MTERTLYLYEITWIPDPGQYHTEIIEAHWVAQDHNLITFKRIPDDQFGSTQTVLSLNSHIIVSIRNLNLTENHVQ